MPQTVGFNPRKASSRIIVHRLATLENESVVATRRTGNETPQTVG